MTTNTTEAKAIARYVRISPFKVRRVLDQIRGRSYREALIILEFMPYRATEPVLKVLRSAAANAEHNAGLDRTQLVITQAYADQGPQLKRFQPRAQGRAYEIRKPTCHITVAVASAFISSPPSSRKQGKPPQQEPKANQEDFMNKIDAYLIFEFGLLEERLKGEAEVAETTSTNTIRLDMLVRVEDPSWNPQNIQDYEETFRLGQSVGCIGSRHTIKALQEDPAVIYVEASRPGSGWECSFPDPQSNQQVSSSVPLSVPIKADQVHQFEKGDKALIGIIDSGIDVLHDAFLDPSGSETRILTIWDQTDETNSNLNQTNSFCPFGREYTKEEIDKYIEAQAIPPTFKDERNRHGTHVASIAAGRSGEHFLGGIAPEAKIVVVKIDPQHPRGVPFTHGYALQYIEHIANKVGMPVVVNVSQGINAGSHDGQSNLECLYNNDFLRSGKRPGYAVVKSAGNQRNTERHAKFNVTLKSSFTLILNCGESVREEEFIELWFDSGHRLEFRIENPSHETTSWVTQTNKLECKTFSTNNVCLMDYKQLAPNGDSVLKVAIKKASANSIEGGFWKLAVRKASGIAEQDDIHAWIEVGTTRTAYFKNSDECVTLTIPGTAENVVVVGSVQNISDDFPLHEISSWGPTRRGGRKPDLVAPGVGIYAACSGTDNEICQTSGTSMAAPHVTGAIALLFSAIENQLTEPVEQLNASQICSAIRRTTQDFYGNWDKGRGCGVLDVSKLFEHFGLIGE